MSASLDSLRQMLAAATELPWQPMNAHQWDTIIGGIDGPDDGNYRYETITDITTDHIRSKANARLLVAAVNALPALLDRVERAEADYFAQVAHTEQIVAQRNKAEAERDALAKDAARFAWLESLPRAAAFCYGEDGADVALVFTVPRDMRVSADLRKSIDAALTPKEQP